MRDNESVKTTYSDDFGSHLSKKSKKSKSKKKKAKKEKKKYKKKKKYSTSSSSSESSGSETLEWMEKTIENQTSSCTTKSPNNSKAQEEFQLKRDEWMNMESFLPCISKSEMKKAKPDPKEEDKLKNLLDKPGQSDRELNPYWKDGGNGLPQINSERFDNQSILDANWLKKSLRRAEEQALRDGRSLEEIAAERWGSLEAIRSMIAKAERMSNSEQEKFYHKKSYDNRNKKNSWRTSSSRRRNHSRSRSRSQSRSRSRSKERIRKSSTHYSTQSTGQKQMYQRPKENDDYYQQTVHVSSSSRVKNWKKDKDDDRKCETVPSSSELKETNADKISNVNKVARSENTVLSEAEMNKLGAKIVKAEIMGDEQLATQLKEQLEQARKLAATNKATVQEGTVILTRTDEKGVARPILPRSQLKQEGRKKKKIAETHVSGERIRHFADDDKYSLHDMFQREKGRSANEDEAIFTKFASRGLDHMDDMFEQQIAQTDLEAKDDKRDRMRAIKEHKDVSKYLDNCWWCLDSKNMLKHMIVTMDSMICLSLPACTSLTTGHCILTPVQHVACQLQLDENVWEKLKELKRKLTTMFTNEDFYPVFFEVYKKRHRFSHMQLECVPLPKDIGELAPMYFKKALLECETEWSMNKKVIDLKSKDIRHAVPNGLSYFMIEFASYPGYAHVIEDEEMFPKNFAEEVIGGMLDLDNNLWRKPRKQSFDEQRVKVLEFTKTWKKCNSLQEDI